MSRMIKSDVETPQRRKRFNLAALRVCVADRTDLAGGVCELLCMTTRAGRMRLFARQRGLRRVALPAMTKQTRQPRMVAVIVFELRIIGLRERALIAGENTSNQQ
jgi:hypothetical protein